MFLKHASLGVGGMLMHGFVGCSRTPDSGPVEVKWDRDTCEYCRMVISDMHYAAQVRDGETGKVYNFDDIGCALNWLAAHPQAYAAELWVADHRHQREGRWLDARSAYYVSGQTTPMDYGFGAQDVRSADSVALEAVRARVLFGDRPRGR